MLGGCAGDDALQNLRRAEAENARQEALAECRMIAHWRPGDPTLDKIVETCTDGIEPDIYRRRIAEDQAQISR